MGDHRPAGDFLDPTARYSPRDVAEILSMYADIQGEERPPTGAEVVQILEAYEGDRRSREAALLRAGRAIRLIPANARPPAAEAVARG